LITALSGSRHKRASVLGDLIGLGGGRVALDGAVGGDEELGEVPFDARAQQAAGLALQPREYGMGVLAVDVDLGGDWESHPVVHLAELLDSRVVAWLLMHELIARKSEDDQTLGSELLVDLLQALVLGREPALARGIDNEKWLAAVLGHIHGLAVVVDEGQVIKALVAHGPSVHVVRRFCMLALAKPINVGSMINTKDANLAVDDLVDDAIDAAACRVHSVEFAPQGFAHPKGFREEVSFHEHDNRGGNRWLEPAQASSSPRGHGEEVLTPAHPRTLS